MYSFAYKLKAHLYPFTPFLPFFGRFIGFWMIYVKDVKKMTLK